MIEFGKMYCNFHPHQLITNFCNKDECLVGLCANCICTHTQSHMQKGTSPDYQNIRTTYQKVQDNIRTQVGLFQQDKDRIDKIRNLVSEKRQKVKQIIEMAKDEVSVLLGNYFEEKEKEMIRQIEAQQKKYGLHCDQRLQSLNSYIQRQVSNMISAAQELSSSNFLQSLPRIRTQSLINSEKLHADIQGQIVQNQRFQTTISCNKAFLPSLIETMNRVITLGFSGASQNQRMRRDSSNLPRPVSQGKQLERNFSTEQMIPSFNTPMQQRNTQSQLNINNIRPSQPIMQNLTKNTGPVYKSSYLSEIPGMRPSGQNMIPRMNSQQNFNRTSNDFSQRINNVYPNGQISTQPNNYPTNLQAGQSMSNFMPMQYRPPTNRAPQQPYGRTPEKPFNSIVQNYPVQAPFNPNLNLGTVQKPLQKSGAQSMSKRPKKSGLKLLTSTDADSDYLQNVQNQRPRQNLAPYY